jgi:uncharacterized protein YbbC (DUF1343 family)
VLTGTALIGLCRTMNPAAFAWRKPPYEYEHEKEPFDILAGSSVLRTQIERGVPAADIADGWRDDERAFQQTRRPFLLYT